MYKVKQVAEYSGISIRTLHHYDEIGLLKPKIGANGYRQYDDADLAKLQQILFFKELDFKLDGIKNILSNPAFDYRESLYKHKQVLESKKERLEKIIDSIDVTIESLNGGRKMTNKERFEAFDMKKIEEHQKKYESETKERWGNSDAYKQSHNKTKKYTKEDWERVHAQTNAAYQLFLDAMVKGPESKEAMIACEAHRQSITDNFYDCSMEIYVNLGEMYVADERFTKNINKIGEGLAEFMSEAIKIYCTR